MTDTPYTALDAMLATHDEAQAGVQASSGYMELVEYARQLEQAPANAQKENDHTLMTAGTIAAQMQMRIAELEQSLVAAQKDRDNNLIMAKRQRELREAAEQALAAHTVAWDAVIQPCYDELKKALGRDIGCPAYIPDAIKELAALALRGEPVAWRAVVSELLELKAIKDQLDVEEAAGWMADFDSWRSLNKDYHRRFPLAWKAARDILAAPISGELVAKETIWKRRKIVWNWMMGEGAVESDSDGGNWHGGTEEVKHVDELLNALAPLYAAPISGERVREAYYREALESIVSVHDMYCDNHVGVSKHSYDLYYIAQEALAALPLAAQPEGK